MRPSSSPGTAFLWALVIKGVAVLVFVLAAAHYPADERYVAPREGQAGDAVWALSRGFDSQCYQRMSLEGYYDRFSRAFPPVYPALVRVARVFTDNGQQAAVLASNGAALGALVFFLLIARRYAQALGRASGPAAWLFACTPGWLAFGTVAYSESTFLLLALAAWWAYLRAEDPGASSSAPASTGQRSLGWLALASLLGGASVLARHAGAPLLLAWALIELVAVLRAPPGARSRGLGEALALLWSAPAVVAYFVWKYRAHDLAAVQEEIWRVRFSPLGAVPSLVSEGAEPLFVLAILMSLPLALLLLARTRAVDPRLTLVAGLMVLLSLSFTGASAQALTRYIWTVWPLALGGLALRDRGVVAALCGVLALVSLWVGVGHVLGTAAL